LDPIEVPAERAAIDRKWCAPDWPAASGQAIVGDDADQNLQNLQNPADS
jgi:hypothetical protein